MLVVRGGGGGMGDESPPAALARDEGPWASGYVLPDASTLATARAPAKKKKTALASSPRAQVIAASEPDTSSIADRLKSIPTVVWILLGLGALAGAWWYTGKGKGRRRKRGRPFVRGKRRR